MASPRRTKVDLVRLLAKLKEVPGSFEKVVMPLVEQEARLFVRDVVKVTPPASQGIIGMKAKKQGESAVAGDIRKVYGTPGGAYNDLALKAGQGVAKVFWKAVKANDVKLARDLLRKHAGPRYRGVNSITSFDGGTMHKRFRNSQGRISRERIMMLVTNEAELKKYIKQEQGKVGLLASGWVRAAQRTGQSLPAWVTRHGPGRGACLVVKNQDQFYIIISNRVKYGVALDMQRRADYVLGYRERALKKRLPFVIKAALRDAGMD